MLVIGVDCGTARTGYGVISSDGHRHLLLTAGTIVSPARRPLPERLLTIASGLRRVIREQAPEAAAVEGVFHAVNARSALSLAHVRGIALLALAEAGLAVGEYSPLEVKMSVAGYGHAEKTQVQRMVHSLLALDTGRIGSQDACDALAVAICHATHLSASRRLEEVRR